MERNEQDGFITRMVGQLAYVMVLPSNDSRKESNAKVVLKTEQALAALLSSLKAKVTRHDTAVRDEQGIVTGRQYFTYGTTPLRETTQLPPQQGEGGEMAQLLMVATPAAAAEQPTAAHAAPADESYGGQWQLVGDGRRGGRGKRRNGRGRDSSQRGAANVGEGVVEEKEATKGAVPPQAAGGEARLQQAGDARMDTETSCSEQRPEPVATASFPCPSSPQ